MRYSFLAAIMGLAAVSSAAPISPTGCPSCVINSAAPQEAQVNLGTATVRGILTASTISVTNLMISNLVATSISGSGAGITDLNASQISSGILASARLIGGYTGITGVGTLVSGIWNGTVIGSQYGGTGQNFSTALRGYIPFFSGTGTWATLPTGSSGSVLQTNGVGADPSWTGSPTIIGTNISAIPPANLAAGTLPATVVVNDTSITSISAAKVSGNIPGNAAGLSNLLPVSSLAAGTFLTSNPASSITATGASPGVYGGAAQALTVNLRSDGRLNSISQQNIILPPAQISAGALPAGVTLPAAGVNAGDLGPNVVASSLAPTGVTPGIYGGNPGRTLTVTVAGDGRLSSVSQQNILLVPSQLSAGTLPSNVTVPAANLTAGLLGGDVIAQHLNPTGVSSGTYGGPSQSAQITISTDGRVTQASQFYLTSFGHVISSLISGTTSAFPREPTLAFDANDFVVTDDPYRLSTVVRSATSFSVAAATTSLSLSTAALQAQKVNRDGDTMTGTLNLTGASSFLNTQSSVNASGFFGSGAGLTFPPPSNFVKSTSTVLGVNMTNSSSWVTVPGSALSLSLTSSQYIRLEYSCNIKCVSNTRCGAAFSYQIDGLFSDGMGASTSSGLKYIETANTITDSPASVTIVHRSTATKSIGPHTVSLLWASPDGVDISMGNNVVGCALTYKGDVDALPIGSGGAESGTSGAVTQLTAGSNVTLSPASGLGNVTISAASAGAPGVVNNGAQTQASLTTLTCPVLPCQAQGTFGMYDIYVATGIGPGQWMNARTGTGP